MERSTVATLAEEVVSSETEQLVGKDFGGREGEKDREVRRRNGVEKDRGNLEGER